MNLEDAGGVLAAIGRLTNTVDILQSQNGKLADDLTVAGQLLKEMEEHIEKIEALLPEDVRTENTWQKPEVLPPQT